MSVDSYCTKDPIDNGDIVSSSSSIIQKNYDTHDLPYKEFCITDMNNLFQDHLLLNFTNDDDENNLIQDFNTTNDIDDDISKEPIKENDNFYKFSLAYKLSSDTENNTGNDSEEEDEIDEEEIERINDEFKDLGFGKVL